MKKIQSYVVLHAACIAVYTTIVIAQDARERLVFVALTLPCAVNAALLHFRAGKSPLSPRRFSPFSHQII